MQKEGRPALEREVSLEQGPKTYTTVIDMNQEFLPLVKEVVGQRRWLDREYDELVTSDDFFDLRHGEGLRTAELEITPFVKVKSYAFADKDQKTENVVEANDRIDHNGYKLEDARALVALVQQHFSKGKEEFTIVTLVGRNKVLCVTNKNGRRELDFFLENKDRLQYAKQDLMIVVSPKEIEEGKERLPVNQTLTAGERIAIENRRYTAWADQVWEKHNNGK